MKKITKFPKLVIEEAKNLRKFATPEELNRLDFDSLNSESASSCIYGQMTSSCNNDRAVELIQHCTKRVYNAGAFSHVYEGTKLNGSPMKRSRHLYWSPIEVFISRAQNLNNEAMNKKLIEFLKGERKTLV